MTCDTQQRLAVSALIEYLRHSVKEDAIPAYLEMDRLMVAVERAFSDTPPRIVQVGDHEPEPTSFAVSMAEYLPVPNPKMGEPK